MSPHDQGRDSSGLGGSFGTSGGSGRAGRFFARVFENPDNPLGWSVHVFDLAGIAVRLHLFTIIFVAVELLWSIPAGNLGIGFMAIAMASLLVLVLLHEFGHCFACRWIGGSADRVVLLPFGGLALVRPPDHWVGHLAAAAGGPMVNVLILPISSAALSVAGLGGQIVFNPFTPGLVLSDPAFASATTAGAWAKYALWWMHYINIVILGFNVLVPAYPMDGGRLLQAGLWARLGYERATLIAIYVGFAASMALGVLGIAANRTLLAVIAIFCLWSCWVELRRLRGEEDLGRGEYALGMALGPAEDLEDPWTVRRRLRDQRRREQEQAELDRILARIASEGMSSLTRRERRTLKRATERKRKERG